MRALAGRYVLLTLVAIDDAAVLIASRGYRLVLAASDGAPSAE
jgi:hypothetical protein